MRRWLLSACASAIATSAAAGELEPLVLEFRLPARAAAVEALAWRRDGEIYATRQTLTDLGLDTSGLSDDGPIALSAARGVSYRFVASEQAVEIVCAGGCLAPQTIGAEASRAAPLLEGAGAFLNVDLLAERVSGEAHVSGAFDLGLFRPGGFGGLSWTMGADDAADIVRLDSNWTIDLSSQRQRVLIGDGVTSSTGGGAPFRFGGVQWGTDFALDPAFTPFPTPTFAGEAATPSTVDLYINGALQARMRVDAGPFALTDAPVVAGGGQARLVVTDALGRERIVGAPFYASPLLLRPGLSDFTIAAGATRRNFTRASFDYADGFVLAAYRRGLTDWMTVETRLEWSKDVALLGAGVALARPWLGEFNARAAFSEGQDEGALIGAGWSWQGPRVSVAFNVESASDGFRRIGQDETLPRRRAQATFGLALGELGSLSLTGARQETRASGRVETLNLAYAPPAGRFGALSFSALYVDDGEPFTTASIGLVRPLGQFGSASAAVQADDGDLSLLARAQSSPPNEGGWGWRLGAEQGARERLDAGAMLRGRTFEARLEAAHAAGEDGLRGQFETALVWMDGETLASRIIRDGFVLVDAGAPHVGVLRDRQRVGHTDQAGRFLVTGLRPYDSNRIGVEIDDLPLEALVTADEMIVRTAARSGARLSFGVQGGRAGEVRIVDAHGAPLPEGVMLIRDTDQARFPIGRNGRAYVSGVAAAATLVASGAHACRVLLTPSALESGAPLQCVG